jgi:hypothetical protein
MFLENCNQQIMTQSFRFAAGAMPAVFSCPNFHTLKHILLPRIPYPCLIYFKESIQAFGLAVKNLHNFFINFLTFLNNFSL